ncbi:hypothetical protein [Chiayiivirga flava]|uniref:Putative delta-60 repeat protein n=1 Tax=Chiayiivirga flava TaxID=659595 RepID=A0A7W8G0J2_9GAMM|nr:hypothetical protein [Chiayiivirga flava]MBB5209557.1 putative delta-60 repeat protein [Chiayiivirga flava]
MRAPVTALLFATSVSTVSAAPPTWQPDPSFGNDGATTLTVAPGTGDVDTASLLVSDQQRRLYTIGQSLSGENPCLALARLLPDGEIDTSYGDDGHRCLGNLFEGGGVLYPTDAYVDAGGELVVAGYDMKFRWPVVCRFDATGELDIGRFGSLATPGCQVLDDMAISDSQIPGEPTDAPMHDVTIVPDGDRIRVALNHSSLAIHLARLTSGGDVVPFGQTSSIELFGDKYNFVSDTLMTDDGRLALAGIIFLNGSFDFFAAIVDPDSGEVDDEFNNGTPLIFTSTSSHSVSTALTLDAEGHLVVAGVSANDPDATRPTVAVVTRQGQLLPTFNEGSPMNYDPCMLYVGKCAIYATAVETLADGKILLGGYAVQDGYQRAFTMRLGVGGSPDPDYGPDLPGQQGYAALADGLPQVATSMLWQNGKTILAGWRDVSDLNGIDILVTRLSDGALFGDGFEQ